MSRLDRVIFYSIHDGMVGNMLEKTENLMEKQHEFSAMDTADLLEFHHVHQHFEKQLYLRRWSEPQKGRYIEKVKLAMDSLKTFFLNLKPDELIDEIKKLEFHNRKNFWELIRLYEVYKRITPELFLEVLNTHPDHIRYILEFRQIVIHFNQELRAFLLSYENSAELLLSYFEESTSQETNYIFPKSLTDADKHDIISSYLDTELPNPNYVELAINSKELKLPPKLLLKAKQKAKALNNHYFNEENSTSIAVSAALGTVQSEPVTFEKNGEETTTVYGALYLDSLSTETELFSAFQHLFGYTNQYGMITLINKETDMVGLEQIFIHSKSEYRRGFRFQHKDMKSHIQLELMKVYLTNKERTMESLIDGFIREFLIDKYNLGNLEFKIPSVELGPGDKIRLLAPEMEYLIKQYKHYVTDGLIDHDLLQIDSTQMFLSGIPSLVDKKYITSEHPTISRIQQYFFDRHGILSGRKDQRDNRNLFQILMTERVITTELTDYQLHYIDQMIHEGFLVIAEANTIQMVNPIQIFIAGEIRECGCMSYWHYSKPIRETIDKLIGEGILTVINQLLTPKEISYINYYLNKKEFSNSLDLRNKYMHGSNNRTIKIQKQDYIYVLRTLVLILLKLKDDLELKTLQDLYNI